MNAITIKRITCAMLALTVVSSCGGGAQRNSSGVVVKVGDCSNSDLSQIVDEVDLVPCDKPHALEAYSIITSTATTYPGADALQVFADQSCIDKFFDYVGVELSQSILYYTYVYPSVTSWNSKSDRSVICFIYKATEPLLTKSVKGSKL
ncbi:MAG: septum formation family protein [Ilumatobacteraceae bacterium]|nr:septum formation family protein [Ilumatobacteraceae bacterium]